MYPFKFEQSELILLSYISLKLDIPKILQKIHMTLMCATAYMLGAIFGPLNFTLSSDFSYYDFHARLSHISCSI